MEHASHSRATSIPQDPIAPPPQLACNMPTTPSNTSTTSPDSHGVSPFPLMAILLRTCFSLLTQYPIFLHQRRLALSTPLWEAFRNAESKRRNERAKREEEVEETERYSRLTMLASRHFRYNRYIAMLPLVYLPFWWISWNSLARICMVGQSLLGEPSADLLATQSSMASEGLLWFPDLTASDPILLLALGGLSLANVAVQNVQGFKLPEPFSTPDIRQETGIVLFRTMAFVCSVLMTSLFAASSAPAAVTLFCIFSSLTALITRAIFKRLVRISKPLILPARPRPMQMRKRITDEHGHHHYAESQSVPREWDDVFIQRRFKPAPPASAAASGKTLPSRLS
jgi:hypothetical protein